MDYFISTLAETMLLCYIAHRPGGLISGVPSDAIRQG